VGIKAEGIRGRLLSIILALAVLGGLGSLGYVMANPKVEEKFTEFYILGLEGRASGYPEKLSVGEKGEVIVGIINREQEVDTYWVEVTIDGVKNTELKPVTLGNAERREEIISFTPNKAGDNQKVEFLLYQQGRDGVYQKLHLWVDVQ
jgi:uncharacterized membrane protein